MKKLGMHLAVLLFGVHIGVLMAQAPEKPVPTFALSIKEGQLSAPSYQPTDHEVLVKYTNVSDVIQNDGCMITPAAYKVLVLRDGIAVEKRKPKKQIQDNDEENGKGIRTKVAHPESDYTCQRFDIGLKPGEGVKFPLWVSSEYDMTVPGTYEITVTRETEENVTVRSNTLTIVVPRPGAVGPK